MNGPDIHLSSPYPFLIAVAGTIVFSIMYGTIFYAWQQVRPIAVAGADITHGSGLIDVMDVIIMPVLPLAMLLLLSAYIFIRSKRNSDLEVG